MKKQLLIAFLILLTSITSVAQNVLYDVDNAVTNMNFTTTTGCDGCSVSTATNPDASDTEATNVLLWKIAADPTLVAADVSNKTLNYSFPDGLVIKEEDFATLKISVRLYFPSFANFSNFDSNERFRLYLGSVQSQAKLKEADEAGWYTLEFDYTSVNVDGKFPSGATGGDFRLIGQEARFTNLDNDLDFYFDTITSTVALSEVEEEEQEDLDAVATLDAGNEWYFNYSPNTFNATVNEVTGGVFLEQGNAVATPSTTENSSPLVAKFTKEDEVSSQVKFQLPAVITTENQSAAIFKIRAYVPSTNNAPGTIARRFRLFLRNGNETVDQRNVTFDVAAFDEWEEYTFDFTGNLKAGVSYSTVNLLFDQPDTEFDATGNVYYLDAFQGPSAATLPVDSFELSNASIVAYPNPVTNNFQINSSGNVENVKLYNVSGRLVKTFKASANYDVSDLAKGVYITTIKTELGSKTLRVLKK